jgi:hypothetical protein
MTKHTQMTDANGAKLDLYAPFAGSFMDVQVMSSGPTSRLIGVALTREQTMYMRDWLTEVIEASPEPDRDKDE